MPLEVLPARKTLATTRDLAHVHALRDDTHVSPTPTTRSTHMHTFCTLPSVTTCCAVGTLRPRLFFVRLAIGTGAGARVARRRRGVACEPSESIDMTDVPLERRVRLGLAVLP